MNEKSTPSVIPNPTGISLAMAVWLVNDDYDYNSNPMYVSVTTLMKPMKQIILAARAKQKRVRILSDMIPSAIGNALHTAVESAWVNNYKRNLAKLGYPQAVIDRILVNPTDEQVAATKDAIPVYLEQRKVVKVGNWFVGGKFDLVAEGIVQDTKSTTAFTWVYGGKDEDYKMQGSLYKWLNPDKITEDYIRINFIFTDWSKQSATSNPKYPPERVMHKDIPLMEVSETDAWVKNKLQIIENFWDKKEEEMPECSDEELWRSAPVFKYYKDATKVGGRSTRNFDNLAEANQLKNSNGAGVVITVPGVPKRCGYCDAFDICTQKDRYEHD